MKKYAGKEDYTAESINMIVGVGFDDLIEAVKELFQRMGCIKDAIIPEIKTIAQNSERIYGQLYDQNSFMKQYFYDLLNQHYELLKDYAITHDENKRLKEENARLKNDLPDHNSLQKETEEP
jgi:hypothetical protein